MYLNDILIYSETMEDMKRVREVLRKLVKAKLSKCNFHKISLDYLDYCIFSERVEIDPGKVKSIHEWEAPQTRRQLPTSTSNSFLYSRK